jgi:hypothetical protein
LTTSLIDPTFRGDLSTTALVDSRCRMSTLLSSRFVGVVVSSIVATLFAIASLFAMAMFDVIVTFFATAMFDGIATFFATLKKNVERSATF